MDRKYHQNTTNCQHFPQSTDFPHFVEIIQTKQGQQRINDKGYTYGLSKKYLPDTTRIVWRCTRSSSHNSNSRCPANIETDTIDGYTKMRYKNQRHRCFTKID